VKRTSFLLLSFSIFTVLGFFAFAKSYEAKVVSAALDNMNLLYMGINNPLTVAIENYPCEKIELFSESLNIKKVENGKYNIMATRPGNAKIKVSGDGLPAKLLEFRVKRIPNPILVLRARSFTEEPWKGGGSVFARRFIQMKGVDAEIHNFAFDTKCKIVSFEITRVPQKGDPVMALNKGSQFSEVTQRLINKAKAGDQYYFDNVLARCPGDLGPRNLNSMVHKIK